jgi:hypothetical protein
MSVRWSRPLQRLDPLWDQLAPLRRCPSTRRQALYRAAYKMIFDPDLEQGAISTSVRRGLATGDMPALVSR